jgi:hypothetical protein
MPKLFSSPDNENLTATDYISRKRNLTIYCDYGKENNGRKLAKNYTNGQLQSAINHSSLLNLTKGYYDYHQRVDISNNFYQSYVGEKFDDTICKRPDLKNTTTNTNYTGMLLVNDGSNNQVIQDTSFSNVVNYNKIESKAINNVSKDERIHKTKCFQFPLVKLMKKS